MKELKVQADTENLQPVMEFIRQEAKALGCPAKTMMQIELAAEEIFTNIAFYAYDGRSGTVSVCCETENETENEKGNKKESAGSILKLTFSDSGKPFNPLEKECGDLTLPAGSVRLAGSGYYLQRK